MNHTEELIKSCKRVHWYEPYNDVLSTPHLYLLHVMAFGNESDVTVAQKYYSTQDFINAIDNAIAGKFDQERWDNWRERLGLEPKKAPRRYEDDTTPLDWWRGFN